MELKYYLRGLGLGIIVTAIIMAVVTSGSQTMTDAEVIRRAKQLGMIEDKVLSESAQKKEDTAGEDAPQDEDAPQNEDASVDTNEIQTQNGDDAQDTQLQQTDPEADNTEQTAPEETGEEEETQPQETERTNTALPISDTPMVITIGPGDGSYAASRKLADVGAISSPENFDTFLCENGYDKKIRPGTYTIPADASDEQMARIITGEE